MLTKDEYDKLISIAEDSMFKAEEMLRRILSDIWEMDIDTLESVELGMTAYNTLMRYNYDNVLKSIMMQLENRRNLLQQKELEKTKEE